MNRVEQIVYHTNRLHWLRFEERGVYGGLVFYLFYVDLVLYVL